MILILYLMFLVIVLGMLMHTIRKQDVPLKECNISFFGVKIHIKTEKKSKDKDDCHTHEKSSRKK